MKNAIVAAAICGLNSLERTVPADVAAAAAGFGLIVAQLPSYPIHPQTAERVNMHFPGLFDEDDLAVFQTTFFSRNH